MIFYFLNIRISNSLDESEGDQFRWYKDIEKEMILF